MESEPLASLAKRALVRRSRKLRTSRSKLISRVRVECRITLIQGRLTAKRHIGGLALIIHQLLRAPKVIRQSKFRLARTTRPKLVRTYFPNEGKTYAHGESALTVELNTNGRQALARSAHYHAWLAGGFRIVRRFVYRSAARR
jgi:hypothetical protein